VGREQQHRLGRLERPLARQLGQPLAERPVADLVVVLEEVDEGQRRQVGRALAAHGTLLGGRGLARVDEALAEHAGEPSRRPVGEILVVAGRLRRVSSTWRTWCASSFHCAS
jgi:uncharacterized protein YgbK (DUF1537 family)